MHFSSVDVSEFNLACSLLSTQRLDAKTVGVDVPPAGEARTPWPDHHDTTTLAHNRAV